jgi:hypothetical protein
MNQVVKAPEPESEPFTVKDMGWTFIRLLYVVLEYPTLRGTVNV